MIMEQKLCAACVALAVFGLVMAVPQGSALARGGMEVRTADLCLILANAAADEMGGIGTVAAVTDNRTRLTKRVTAWAVSLEGMLKSPPVQQVYKVYDIGPKPEALDCVKDIPNGAFKVYDINTDKNGEAFRNTFGDNLANNPDVEDVIQICRCALDLSSDPPACVEDSDGLIPILEGVLVKGGKEKNKPNRC